jgi:hypothetical protein
LRPLGVDPIVHFSDAALLIEGAHGIVGAGNAKIAKLPPIELRRFISHNLLQHQRRSPGADRQSIGLDSIVKMIGSDKPARASHVLDDPSRVSRQVPADVARQYAGVEVERATGRITHDDRHGLVFIKILPLGGRLNADRQS